MGSDEVIYNIPLSLREHYRRRLTILRSANARELSDTLRDADRSDIISVQILSPTEGFDRSAGAFYSMPVDLLLVNVEQEFPYLYQWTWLLAEGPARVSIPVIAGFGRAVKLAVALGFAVKLEATQPDATAIDELHQVLDIYLHQPCTCQPIEFFHSLLLACFHDQLASLWAIQEEDPAAYCFVTDEGKETISRRLTGEHGMGDARLFFERFQADLMGQGRECRNCEHIACCAGYFKWPDPAYRCEGVKSVMREIQNAGKELQRDAGAFSARQENAGA